MHISYLIFHFFETSQSNNIIQDRKKRKQNKTNLPLNLSINYLIMAQNKTQLRDLGNNACNRMEVDLSQSLFRLSFTLLS